jgi:hypothetical protein
MALSDDSKIKIGIFLLPLVFSAGLLVSTLTNSTEAVEAEIEEVKTGLAVHSALKAHPVTAERLSVIMKEQAEMRSEIKSQSISLAGICVATGARCR